MTRRTAFFFDELSLWHSASQHALFLPVGGWVQPPAGGGHAESPESKRRLKNLMDVSGLTRQLDLRSAEPASEQDLLRVHPEHYLQRFKALSDPNRLRILSIVSASEAAETCVCDLSEPLELKQPTVSHHLKILVDAGILHREKRGVWAYFSVIPGALESLGASLVAKK